MLFPEHGGNSGFDVTQDPFDASSEVRLRSSLSSIPDVINVTPFNHDVYYRSFHRSSSWRFEAFPYRTAPKGPPSSLVQHGALAPS